MTTLDYLLHGERESFVLENFASKNLLGYRTMGFFWVVFLMSAFRGDFFEVYHRNMNLYI